MPRQIETTPRGLCRRLWPSDQDAVEALFLRLDDETRAARFMAAVSDRVALAYAERAFSGDGMMFGAFVDGTLRGVGEIRPAGRYGFWLRPKAEAAFAVERSFRREGLGAMLFRRVIGAARNRGIAEIHVRCLNDNAPMRRLAMSLGAELSLSGPETDGALRLDRPSPLSIWQESLADAFELTLGLFTAAGRRQTDPRGGAPQAGRAA